MGAWSDRHGSPAALSDAPGLAVGGLEELTVEQVADACAEQHLWVHAAWSPVPPGPPRRALAEAARLAAGGACGSGLGDAGGWVEFDGHVDAPHLQAALDGLPVASLRPLLLVEAP